jgi:hypothetical protein
VDQQRRVATVVKDHVRPAAVRPEQRLFGAPPILFERLALPGVDGHTPQVVLAAVRADDDRGSGMVLGREDVAGDPTDVGAERDQGLDEHGGLDRHMQRAHDPRTLERLGLGVLGADRHQPGHFVLGEADLLAAELGESQVRDFEVETHAFSFGARLVPDAVPMPDVVLSLNRCTPAAGRCRKHRT